MPFYVKRSVVLANKKRAFEILKLSSNFGLVCVSKYFLEIRNFRCLKVAHFKILKNKNQAIPNHLIPKIKFCSTQIPKINKKLIRFEIFTRIQVFFSKTKMENWTLVRGHPRSIMPVRLLVHRIQCQRVIWGHWPRREYFF